MNVKIKQALVWTPSVLVSFIFIASGIFKLSGAEGTVEMAKGVGGNENLVVLGVLELIITAIFLYNRTAVAGALLMIAYIGGAMAVHFVNNQPLRVVIGIQVLIWAASYLRFPELSSRLKAKKTSGE